VSGDYTQTGLLFKVKKTLRYIRLYGPSRTWVKIRGQYHMKASGTFEEAKWVNPRCGDPERPGRNIALIGCGNYAFSVIAYYLAKRDARFLRAVCDPRKERALSLCKAYGGAYATADGDVILADPEVKTVYIASNHASHAEYAIACIEAGKHVHIEKPHVVTEDQLERLMDAMRRYPDVKVFLGFNRPRSPLFLKLRSALARETGSLMINWFIAGHEIADDHWYFDEKEGGRVLGNLCHWTDLTLHLVSLENAFPCVITPGSAPGSKSDFVVSVLFADQSCAAITFSAKGHTFEGVREVLNIHKGNVLANLSDFQSLTLDVIDKKSRHVLSRRDHGHEINVTHSFKGSSGASVPGEAASYVRATAAFFLTIRRALDSGETIELTRQEALGPERQDDISQAS
jgi:predicted dehydrogenase